MGPCIQGQNHNRVPSTRNGIGEPPRNTSLCTTKFSSAVLLVPLWIFELTPDFFDAVLPTSLKYTALNVFRYERWFVQYAALNKVGVCDPIYRRRLQECD